MATFIESKTRNSAISYAEKNGIVFAALKKVRGWYLAFATAYDYATWKNKK